MLCRSPESLLFFEAWEHAVPSSAPALSTVASEYGNVTSLHPVVLLGASSYLFALLIQKCRHMVVQKRFYTQPNGCVNQMH